MKRKKLKETMTKMEKLREIILKYFDQADCGLFFTRNTVGDPMQIIYEGDGMTVEICFYYSYFEIFGLTEEEEEEISTFYKKLRVERKKETIAEKGEWE